MIDAAYFLEKAGLCFRLSKTDGLDPDLASELSELGQDLMAKAVYLDTLAKRVAESAPSARNRSA